MRGVIVEIRGEYVATLTEDGCVIKLKNNGYHIGQEIEVNQTTKKRKTKLMGWIAATASILLGVGITSYVYMTPCTYVSLDVNPSVEYSLNRFERVLSATAVNDDGEEILQEIQAKGLGHKPIGEAIRVTVEQMEKEGYLVGEGVVIATSAKDMAKAQELAETLKIQVEAELQEKNYSQTRVAAISVDEERMKEAKALGVTPGKLNLVEELKEVSDSQEEIKLEQWIDQPVKDIMDATEDVNKSEGQNNNPIKVESNKEQKKEENTQIKEQLNAMQVQLQGTKTELEKAQHQLEEGKIKAQQLKEAGAKGTEEVKQVKEEVAKAQQELEGLKEQLAREKEQVLLLKEQLQQFK